MFLYYHIALGIGYVLYLILSPRQNVFDSMSKYRPCPVSELPPADKLSKIKRCSKPDEDLEIVYSSKGVGSRETMTITDMFDGAVAKGGNRKIFAVERPKKNSKGEQISDEMEWNFISWKEFGQEVELISKAMIAIGIDPFDIVNLLGFCSPEYVMIHLAAMYCGGMFVSTEKKTRNKTKQNKKKNQKRKETKSENSVNFCFFCFFCFFLLSTLHIRFTSRNLHD